MLEVTCSPIMQIDWFLKTQKPKKSKHKELLKTHKLKTNLEASNMLFDNKSSVYRETGFQRWSGQTHTWLTDIAT